MEPSQTCRGGTVKTSLIIVCDGTQSGVERRESAIYFETIDKFYFINFFFIPRSVLKLFSANLYSLYLNGLYGK